MASVAKLPGTARGTAEEGPAAEAKSGLASALTVDTEKVRGHLDEVVRSTVEQTLNQLLDEEADRVAGAGRYERSEERVDTRAGSYRRKLQTKAGEVELTVPRLRTLPLETAIIERYKRRESSVEEALIEMYLAGVSMRRVEDITEALWGTRVSASAVSGMAQKVYGQIESWRNRKITGEHAYVYLDGIWLKRSWGGEMKNVAVLIAIGVDAEGYREVLGVTARGREPRRAQPCVSTPFCPNLISSWSHTSMICPGFSRRSDSKKGARSS